MYMVRRSSMGLRIIFAGLSYIALTLVGSFLHFPYVVGVSRPLVAPIHFPTNLPLAPFSSQLLAYSLKLYTLFHPLDSCFAVSTTCSTTMECTRLKRLGMPTWPWQVISGHPREWLMLIFAV